MISLSEVTRNLRSENRNEMYLKNDGYDTLPLFVEEMETRLGSLQEISKDIRISVDDLQVQNSAENEDILIELRKLNETAFKILDYLKPSLDDLEAKREAAKRATIIGRAQDSRAGLFPNADELGDEFDFFDPRRGRRRGQGRRLRGGGRGLRLPGLRGIGLRGLLRGGLRAGGIGLVGSIASQILGGFIGEVTGMPGLGSMVSAVGTGASLGAMFGPVGAVFGGIAGAIIEGGNQLAAAVERARVEMEATADALIEQGRDTGDEQMIAQGAAILGEQAAPGSATLGERAAAAQEVLDRVTDTELQNPAVREALAEQTLALNLSDPNISDEEALRQFVRDIYGFEATLPERLREQLETDPALREQLIIQRANEAGLTSRFVDPNEAADIILDEMQILHAEQIREERNRLLDLMDTLVDPDTDTILPGREEEYERIRQQVQALSTIDLPPDGDLRFRGEIQQGSGDQSSLQIPPSPREAIAGLIRTSYNNPAPVIINAPNNSTTTVASNGGSGGTESGMISTIDGRFSYLI